MEVPRLSVCSFNLNREGKSASNITAVGIDLAKNVFSLRGVDGAGRMVLRKTVRRERLAPLVARLMALYRKSGKNDDNDAKARIGPLVPIEFRDRHVMLPSVVPAFTVGLRISALPSSS